MNTSIFDIIGMIGVFMILITYGAVQMEKMDVRSVKYSVLNAQGAGLILISLIFAFNLSAFVIESAWLVISIYGIMKAFKRKS